MTVTDMPFTPPNRLAALMPAKPAPTMTTCLVAVVIALPGQLAGRPLDDRLDTRRDELERGAVIHPPEFVVLGAAELLDHRQSHIGSSGAGEVIARDLAAAVRPGLRVDLAPVELEIGDQSFLANLADRGGERLLAGLDHSLGKIPVVERTQQQVTPAVGCFANHDYAGRQSRGTRRHERIISERPGG